MANVDIEIASRRYTVACRDGEEEHLRNLAALVDRRAQDATAALGSLSETRQLLFASLLLADDLNDRDGGAPAARAAADGRVADALEHLAARVEAIADGLEDRADNP